MRNWRRRRTTIIAVIILVVLAQFTFFNPVRDIVRTIAAVPIRWLDNSYFALRNTIIVIDSARNLSKENARLNSQVLNLQAQVSQLQSVQAENNQLRQDLGFSSSHPELKLSPASVIAISNINSDRQLTINKGLNDGIKSGQAVVSEGYLVGVIGKVSSTTSEVKLLSNRDVQVPVILTTSQATGILSGGIAGLVVSDVPINANVTKGETIATTDLENIVPSGIAIGKVDSIVSQRQDIFSSVVVTTPINTGTLNQVFVVSQK